jgi:hypothetical protein
MDKQTVHSKPFRVLKVDAEKSSWPKQFFTRMFQAKDKISDPGITGTCHEYMKGANL